jgi:hypothetical protein
MAKTRRTTTAQTLWWFASIESVKTIWLLARVVRLEPATKRSLNGRKMTTRPTGLPRNSLEYHFDFPRGRVAFHRGRIENIEQVSAFVWNLILADVRPTETQLGRENAVNRSQVPAQSFPHHRAIEPLAAVASPRPPMFAHRRGSGRTCYLAMPPRE